MKILCLDLGTTTGWAIAQDGLLTDSGTQCFRGGRFDGGGMRFLRFKRWLEEMNGSDGDFETIYFEEVRRHMGVDAAHAYGGFMAHLTAWCEQHEIAYQGVPVGTIKKAATGKGNAGKGEMIKAAFDRGVAVCDDNQADAVCLAFAVLDGKV